MKKRYWYKEGDRVVLSPLVSAASGSVTTQRATVLKNEGSVLLVEIDRDDREPEDTDGLVEVDPQEVTPL